MSTTLRIHPAWEPASRTLASPGERTLRDAIAQAVEIDPRALTAVDADGLEVDLDHPPVASGGAPSRFADLIVAVGPIVRPFLLPGGAPSRAASRSEGNGHLPEEEPQNTLPLAPNERILATALADIGVQTGPLPRDVDGLIESFPELPAGYGLRSRSPYRFLFATVHALEERRADELDALEARVAGLVEHLRDRLRLGGGSDLDSRLYLLAPTDDGERETLAAYLSTGPRPDSAGRRHRGWRRLVVVPWTDEEDRLRRTACIGQQLAVERTDTALCHDLQAACGRFTPVYSVARWVDHQAQVLLRPVEERLHAIARARIGERLIRFLEIGPHEATASARHLAVRLLAHAGLLAGALEPEGPRIDDLAISWADPCPGPTIDELRKKDGARLRDWLSSLAAGPGPETVPPVRAARAARTAAVAGACRLRDAIEAALERDVFPRFGDADLEFSRFVSALSELARDLEAIGRESSEPARTQAWLAAREERWREEAERQRAAILRAAAPIGLWWHRLLQAVGLAPRRPYERLEGAARAFVEAGARVAVIHALREQAHQGDLSAVFGAVLEIIARLEGLAPAARDLKMVLDREAESNERLLRLQAPGRQESIPDEIRDRLERAVDAIDLAPAVGEALRLDGTLRNLVRIAPEAVVDRIWQSLTTPIDRAVGEVAATAGLPGLEEALESGLRSLFAETLVPHSGPDGQVGALDARTHLAVLVSPALATRAGGEKALVSAIRPRLPALGVSRELPIHVAPSPNVPGLFLIRCVHGLEPRELAS